MDAARAARKDGDLRPKQAFGVATRLMLLDHRHADRHRQEGEHCWSEERVVAAMMEVDEITEAETSGRE